MTKSVVMEAKKVSKSFGHVQALDNVDLRINTGEIIGFVGDNGAGKSTLLKILTGIHKPDSGELYWKGEKVELNSSEDAQELGIAVLHQHLPIIPKLNLSQNFFLTREICNGPLNTLDKKQMDEICGAQMAEMGISKDITKQLVETLSGGEEQTLILARTYFFGSELILLDEPTNNLSVKETRKVLETTRRINESEGIPIVYVTHNIARVFPIADRFVVLERGKKIADIKKTEDLGVRDIEDIIVTGKAGERFIIDENGALRIAPENKA